MGKIIRLRESDTAIAKGLNMTKQEYLDRKAFLMRQARDLKRSFGRYREDSRMIREET